ncbi:Tripartite DNA replication factor [Gurleya vavrai]
MKFVKYIIEFKDFLNKNSGSQPKKNNNLSLLETDKNDFFNKRKSMTIDGTIEKDKNFFNQNDDLDLNIKNSFISKSQTEIEKKIINQKYKLKGNIDALISLTGYQTILEIKTGKYKDAIHRAQVILYYIMMKDKICNLNDETLLFYVSDGDFMRIKPKHNEIMQILVKRNIISAMKFCIKNKIENKFNLFSKFFEAECRCLDDENCKKISNMNKTIHEYNKNLDEDFEKSDKENDNVIEKGNKDKKEINDSFSENQNLYHNEEQSKFNKNFNYKKHEFDQNNLIKKNTINNLNADLQNNTSQMLI